MWRKEKGKWMRTSMPAVKHTHKKFKIKFCLAGGFEN